MKNLHLEEGFVAGLSVGVLLVVLRVGLSELGRLARAVDLGGEASRVGTVWRGEELGVAWVDFNVLPARLLPSAGHELHLLGT